MKSLSNKLWAPGLALLSCGLMVACSADKEKVSRTTYKSATEPPVITTLANDFEWNDKSLATDACAFLKTKRDDTVDPSLRPAPVFQVYRDIYNTGTKFYGSHAITNLPQILFALSKESSQDWGPMYRSYDRFSFYKLAKREFCSKIPNYCEKLNEKDAQVDRVNQMRNDYNDAVKQIQAAENDIKLARSRKDRDGQLAAQTKISRLRPLRDRLNSEIKQGQSRIETLQRHVKAEGEKIEDPEDGSAPDPGQLVALDKLQKLQTAIADWDSYFKQRWVRQGYTDARNEYIENLVNTRIPGAFDGRSGSLMGSDLFTWYLRYLENVFPSEDRGGILRQLAANIDSLRPQLTTSFTLFGEGFPPKDWVALERDVANAVHLISTKPAGIEDATCKFIIAQRLMAQIIALKGIRQTPELTAEGTLERLSSDPYHSVKHRDMPGVFGVVVDQAWIDDQLMVAEGQRQDIKLPSGFKDENTGAVRPVQYFAWIRMLSHIAETANLPIWIRNDKAPLPEELMPSKLMECSFAFMGISLMGIEPHFIRRNGPAIDINPENTAEGYAMLVAATVDSLRAMDATYRMHQESPDRAFLSIEMIGKLRDNGDIKNTLLNLLYAANKGAMSFYKMPNVDAPTKEALKDAIQSSGAYLRNERLYKFESK